MPASVYWLWREGAPADCSGVTFSTAAIWGWWIPPQTHSWSLQTKCGKGHKGVAQWGDSPKSCGMSEPKPEGKPSFANFPLNPLVSSLPSRLHMHHLFLLSRKCWEILHFLRGGWWWIVTKTIESDHGHYYFLFSMLQEFWPIDLKTYSSCYFSFSPWILEEILHESVESRNVYHLNSICLSFSVLFNFLFFPPFG